MSSRMHSDPGLIQELKVCRLLADSIDVQKNSLSLVDEGFIFIKRSKHFILV